MPDPQTPPEAIHREGFLEKRPVSMSLSTAWKRRWITLTADRIAWSDGPGGKVQSSLPLGPSPSAVLKPDGTELEVRGTNGGKLVLRGNHLYEWHASITALVCGPTLVHHSTPSGTAVVAAALPPAPPVASEEAAALQALGDDLDDRLIARLQAEDIRLLRPTWLLDQPETYRIEYRQQLEARERAGESPLLSADEAVALVRRGDRSVGALT